jgi:redox-sensitive bicupin YhaK (pirin superfamily)
MLVFVPGASPVVRADGRARLVLLGGAPPDGERSSRERIERAARDWKEGRFPKVPGDESEFVPRPDWPGIRR